MTVTTPLGQVLRDDEGMRLEFQRRYDDPIDDVWSALTEPDRMERWIGRWSGNPASGSVLFAMTAEGDVQPEPVTILRCEAPRTLDVEMPTPDGTWRLSLALRETEGGTELRFVHRMAEPYDASSIGPGWQYYFDRLGAELAGAAVPDQWDDYYPALKDAYPLPE